MNLEDSQMALVSIFSALAFMFGMGIGIELYSTTSESSSVLDRTDTVSNRSLNSQVKQQDC